MTYSCRGTVYQWNGPATWFFVNVSKAKTKEIRFYHSHNAAGFGSIPVMVTIGNTTWKTSLFPDKKQNAYILPLKKAVRAAEGIVEGTKIEYTLDINI